MEATSEEKLRGLIPTLLPKLRRRKIVSFKKKKAPSRPESFQDGKR
jgi:hypothetical protein